MSRGRRYYLGSIDHQQEGKYRLTVYAEGIFGDFVRDGVIIRAGRQTSLYNALCINSEAVFSFFNTVDAEASILINIGPVLI
jgi:hypothetical protein